MRFRAILKYVLLPTVIVAAVGAFWLSRMDLSGYRPLIAEKVKEATGRDFEIVGDLKLDIGLTPAVVVEDVRLQNAMFGTRAEMIKARKLEAHVALLPLLVGRIEIRRLALVGPDILLETDEQGRRNWDFSREDDPAPAPPPNEVHAALDLPNLGAVSIENGLLTYRNGMTGKTTKIEVVHFEGWSDSRNAPLAFDLSAAYDGTPFHAAGRLGAFVALGSPAPFPVDITADLTDFQLALKGTVNRPLAPTSSKLSVEINANNLKGLSTLIKMPLPAGPLTLTALAVSEKGALTLSNVEAKVAGSDLHGSARLESRKERSLLIASLTAQHLDLADFQPVEVAAAENGAKAKAKPKESVEDGRLFSAAPLPLNLLTLADAKVDAKVDELILGRVTLDQVSLSARLQDGVLNVEPFTGLMAKGELIGAAAVDATAGGAAKVSLQMSNLDVNTLAQDFDIEDILIGNIDVTANVAGRGDNLRAMMSSLDGKASVVMGKGQVKSNYVDLMGADLLRFAASAGAGETTQVNCAVGRFDIAQGLASSHDILFDTNHMTVKGEGSVSLGAERLGLKFTPRPKGISVVNLAAPWRVEGPLRRPQVSLDEMGAATHAAGTLLSVVNPLALLVPLVTTGADDKNPCLAALDAPPPATAAGKAAPAKPAKKDAGGMRGIIDSVIPGR